MGILNSRGLGGPTITPQVYRTISDWDLIHVFLGARDKDGEWIYLRNRIRDAAGFPEELDSPDEEGTVGDPPALNIPHEVLLWGVPVQYLSMWFSVWRRRGVSDEEAIQRLREKLKEVPPLGGFATV